MKRQWQKGLARTAVWLAAEILLNFLGLDDLADYSEFLSSPRAKATGILSGVATRYK